MSQSSIVQACERLSKTDPIQFARYVIDFMNLDGFSDERGKLKMDEMTMYYITSRKKDGFPDVVQELSIPNNMMKFNFHVFVSKLFEFVIP